MDTIPCESILRAVLVMSDSNASWYHEVNKLASKSGKSINYTTGNSTLFVRRSPFIIIVMDNDIPVGVSVFFFSNNHSENEYYLNIGNVAVKEAYRGKGIFKFMLEIMKCLLRSQMKQHLCIAGNTLIHAGLCLCVDNTNIPAQIIYERCGFITTGSDYKYKNMYFELSLSNQYDYMNDISVVNNIMINSMNMLSTHKIYNEYIQSTVSLFCECLCRNNEYEGIHRFWDHYSPDRANYTQTNYVQENSTQNVENLSESHTMTKITMNLLSKSIKSQRKYGKCINCGGECDIEHLNGGLCVRCEFDHY